MNQGMQPPIKAMSLHCMSVHLIGDEQTDNANICNALRIHTDCIEIFTRTDQFKAEIMEKKADVIVIDAEARDLSQIEYLSFLAEYYQSDATLVLVTGLRCRNRRLEATLNLS